MSGNRWYLLAIAWCVGAGMAASIQAGTVVLYTEDLSTWNDTGRNDLGDGVLPYGVFEVDDVDAGFGTTPFTTGKGLRVVDLTDEDKPEIHGQLAAPLFEPFRVDFQSYNDSTVASSSAIRFRMGNNDVNVTSENNAAFSVSWQADGDVNAKYSGAEDGVGDVDTTSTDPMLNVIVDVTMVANAALSGVYTYDIFGETRTLDPLHYDLYIDGVLLNSSSPGDTKHDDFKNGLQFHYDKSGTTYDTALGLQQFALFGSGTSNTDPDVYYDNIILTTGVDIGNRVPEPASAAGLLIATLLSGATRRRRTS